MHSSWLVIGVWSKAALWFVHGWLLDAMVAPLLVSALLHSATLPRTHKIGLVPVSRYRVRPCSVATLLRVESSMVLLHKVGFHSATHQEGRHGGGTSAAG